MLDAAFAGRVYPPSEPYVVGREKIREFAEAVGADLAEVASPTFPILVSLRATEEIVNDPALGLDWSRVVHGDQRFAYTRPVRAGDHLVSVVTIEEIMSRAGNDFITLRIDISSLGEPVVSVWTRLVARG